MAKSTTREGKEREKRCLPRSSSSFLSSPSQAVDGPAVRPQIPKLAPFPDPTPNHVRVGTLSQGAGGGGGGKRGPSVDAALLSGLLMSPFVHNNHKHKNNSKKQ